MPVPTPSQSYENHVRQPPPLFIVAALVLAANLLWTLYLLVRFPSFGSALGVATAATLIVLGYYARANALIVQNRVIRLEERVRLSKLLPADLQGRIEELSVDQLIALRFASDGEVADLMREVLASGLADKREIKKKIRSWRGDSLRV